jgi:hypothetical protein
VAGSVCCSRPEAPSTLRACVRVPCPRGRRRRELEGEGPAPKGFRAVPWRRGPPLNDFIGCDLVRALAARPRSPIHPGIASPPADLSSCAVWRNWLANYTIGVVAIRGESGRPHLDDLTGAIPLRRTSSSPLPRRRKNAGRSLVHDRPEIGSYRIGVTRASTTFPGDEADFATTIACRSRRVWLSWLNSLLPGIHIWDKKYSFPLYLWKTRRPLD